MPLRFPGSKSYSDDELAQMEAIQRFYTQDIHTELHEFLQMEEDGKKPRFSTTLTDLERSMFQSRLGTGLLCMESENILVNVLQYQTSRQNRDTFRSGYLNDPRNLLCEILKHFVVETLSHAEVNPDLLELVDKWSTFVHHLTMSNVFRPGSRYDETMEAMLVNIRNSFRYQLRPALLKHLSTSSAREHLHWFIQSAKRVLAHGTQFLYFVLRSSRDTPKNCTIPNIQIGHKPLDVVLATSSGRLLQAMVLSVPFQQVFPIGYIPGGLSPVAEQLLRAKIETFGSTDGKIMIPPILAQIAFVEKQQREQKVKSKRQSVASLDLIKPPTEVFPAQFLKGVESGVSRPFREKPVVLEEFVKLHELFIRIASLIQLLEQAYSLAGEGGDLLVYGVTRKHVARLVVDYTLLSNAVRDSMYVVEQHADGLYQHLVRNNQQGQSVWKHNYMQVSSISMLLNDDLEKCHEAAYRVRQQATSYTLTMQQRMESLRGNLNSFINETEDFSKDVRNVLQLKGAEQADLLLDAEIPHTNLLDTCFGIQFSSGSDTEDESTITEIVAEKPKRTESKSKSGKIKKLFKSERGQSLDNIQLEAEPEEPKREKPVEIPAMRITEIRPGLHPLSGISTHISGVGFSDYLVLKVGNQTIEGRYVQDDGPRKVISFASPPSDTEGSKKIQIINPNGEKATASITYYDENLA